MLDTRTVVLRVLWVVLCIAAGVGVGVAYKVCTQQERWNCEATDADRVMLCVRRGGY